MTSPTDRREFLKHLAVASTIAAGTSAAGFTGFHYNQKSKKKSKDLINKRFDFTSGLSLSKKKVAIANGDNPSQITKAAIDALGGMGVFVKKNEKVLIKPNIGWDRTPSTAANTNPTIVKTIVSMCFETGASRVIVTDNPCNDPRRCFTRSGIWKAAMEAGADVLLPAWHRFEKVNQTHSPLAGMSFLRIVSNVDRLINIPVAKHHGLAGFTGAMKNLYGILGGRRNRLHQEIDKSIAYLADLFHPTLTVMDATSVLMRNGPQGGNLADVKKVNEVIASCDQVAVDAYACGHLGIDHNILPYIKLAEKKGLGVPQLKFHDVLTVTA